MHIKIKQTKYQYTQSFSSADALGFFFFSYGHTLKSWGLRELIFRYFKPHDFIVH